MNDPQADTTQVIATLLELMHGSESDTARIAAAKVLLERLSPKIDEESQRHQAEEREASIAEARVLLAELAGYGNAPNARATAAITAEAAATTGQSAATEPVGADQPLALDAHRAAGTTDAAGRT